MNDPRSTKKDKNQHIQVFARVRPINNAENVGKSATVVEVSSSKEVIVRERPQDKLTKKFTFDRVFGPSSKQIDVYNAVVSPLLEEVLAGYNCTVFAYGQTGTGKTYTMEGFSNDPSIHWQSDTNAGIIPRSLSHLFDELRLLDGQEYSVRVSFLELYNEELFDLLSPNDDASKIRLYEDATRKGAVIIHGLEEVTVHNKSEVYKILEKGSEKRQTAATLMNAHSSRSHTVFSITVHIKENTVEGEELLKTGKLNLVDLAGSENVGRSGAVDRRAREAGNINQSLLTLGRVITALVERAPHIPYRESKLTRLLQESLGGRTKTSIIATVSPASVNLEETLSTLDYAHRAKNITNRPEINQKLSKKALLKEYTEEIERLRRDLLATRERNGVYLAQENYNQMQSTIECLGKEVEEKINHIKALEEVMVKKTKLFNDLQMELEEKNVTLHETKDRLKSTKETLKTTKSDLRSTKFDRDVQKHLLEKHVKTEKILYSQANTLLKVADTATDHTYRLHDKIFRKKCVEEENENLGQTFRNNVGESFSAIEQDLSNHTQDLLQLCKSTQDQVIALKAINDRGIDAIIELSKNVAEKERPIIDNLESQVDQSHEKQKKLLKKYADNAAEMTKEQTASLQIISSDLELRTAEISNNGIAENLRLTIEQCARNFETLTMYVKDSLDTLCEKILVDHDRLATKMSRVKEDVETARNRQNNIIKDENDFKTVFENMVQHFQNLEARRKNDQKEILASMNNIDVTCYDVSKHSHNTCNDQVKFKHHFEKEIKSSFKEIYSNVASDFEKNSTIATKSIEESKVLINDFRAKMDESSKNLCKYNELVSFDMQQMDQMSDASTDSILADINKLRKVELDSSANHVKLCEQQQKEVTNLSSEICKKMTDQEIRLTEWNNNVTAQVRTTKHQVDKFLIEDLRRDQPTGSTPSRKEFQYPRNLVTTSPHERIIQRFKEIHNQSDQSDDEDSTMWNADSETLKSESLINSTPRLEAKERKTSTPNDLKYMECSDSEKHSLIKSASTSDLSIIQKRPSFDISTCSESEIYMKTENKENGNEEFVKPDKKIKRLSKTKMMSRRILGSYN